MCSKFWIKKKINKKSRPVTMRQRFRFSCCPSRYRVASDLFLWICPDFIPLDFLTIETFVLFFFFFSPKDFVKKLHKIPVTIPPPLLEFILHPSSICHCYPSPPSPSVDLMSFYLPPPLLLFYPPPLFFLPLVCSSNSLTSFLLLK